jgi:hypothetical protein
MTRRLHFVSYGLADISLSQPLDLHALQSASKRSLAAEVVPS